MAKTIRAAVNGHGVILQTRGRAVTLQDDMVLAAWPISFPITGFA